MKCQIIAEKNRLHNGLIITPIGLQVTVITILVLFELVKAQD